jgi:hypothetical protein
MGWLSDWLSETEAAAAKPVPVAPVTAAPRTPKPEPEIKEVWFQIRPCHNGDLGMIEPAFYSVSDGVLTMHDAKGTPGKQFHLGPNDDPKKIAGRLGREAWQTGAPTSDFNRELHYDTRWVI